MTLPIRRVVLVIGTCAVVPGLARADPLPPLPPAVSTPHAAPPPIASTVWVKLEGRETMVLEWQSPAGWIPVCESPCTTEVPGDVLYRITGPSMKPSEGFSIRGPDPVSLEVKGAPIARTGPLALVFGPIIAVAGAGLAYFAATADPPSPCDYCEREDDRTGALVLGACGVLIGMGLFGAGLADVVKPPPKTTTVVQRSISARPVAAPPRRGADLRVRKPDWLAPSDLHAARGARAVGATLVKFRF